MSESGGESLFSSVGSLSEDFSSNGENDFGTSDFERESSDTNPGLTDAEDEGSDDEQMDDDLEANDVEVEIQDERIHLEDGQLIPGFSFPSFEEAIRSMEEFCDKTFSPLVIRGSDDGTKLNDVLNKGCPKCH